MIDNRAEQDALLIKETKYKDYNFILKVVINVCLASAYSGYCLGYFNAINFDDTTQIFSIFKDRALMQGSLSFCVAAGAALGSYCANFLMEKYSRRQCFIKIAILSITATLLLQTKLLPLLFLCRLIQGLTVGASTVLRSTYIKQFVPLEIAAQLGVINQVLFAVGLISAFAFTYLMSTMMQAEQYWRMVYFLPIVFLAIQLYNIIYHYPYETAKYLLEKGRQEEARQIVALIYKQQYIEERLAQLNKLIAIINNEKSQEMLAIGEAPIPKQLSSNKIAVLAAFHLAILQQTSGIQVIILYAGQIMLSINPRLQKIVPLVLQIEGLVASLYTMNLIATYGRKQLIQYGLLTMGAALLAISFAFYVQSDSESSFFYNILIVVCLFICRGVFSMTIGPILWIYLPEIVQPKTTGVATMANWLSAAFVSFLYPVAVELAGGPSLIFLVFAINVFLGYLINQELMVETKGKAEWQIRKQYDDKEQK